jgi:hypothetical protein
MKDGPHDFLGCPIEKGDIIVYPVRRGSDMYLKRAKIHTIQTILTVGEPVYKLICTNDEGRQVTVEKAARTVVVA